MIRAPFICSAAAPGEVSRTRTLLIRAAAIGVTLMFLPRAMVAVVTLLMLEADHSAGISGSGDAAFYIELWGWEPSGVLEWFQDQAHAIAAVAMGVYFFGRPHKGARWGQREVGDE